jgi:DnaK suppressor protein
MSTDASNTNTEQLLRAELENALAQLHSLEEEYAELLADPGVIQEDRDTTRTVLESARHAAVTAERALERWHQGSYGRCRRCGRPIAPERLEAIPDTDTCVSCA